MKTASPAFVALPLASRFTNSGLGRIADRGITISIGSGGGYYSRSLFTSIAQSGLMQIQTSFA